MIAIPFGDERVILRPLLHSRISENTDGNEGAETPLPLYLGSPNLPEENPSNHEAPLPPYVELPNPPKEYPGDHGTSPPPYTLTTDTFGEAPPSFLGPPPPTRPLACITTQFATSSKAIGRLGHFCPWIISTSPACGHRTSNKAPPSSRHPRKSSTRRIISAFFCL